MSNPYLILNSLLLGEPIQSYYSQHILREITPLAPAGLTIDYQNIRRHAVIFGGA